METPPPKCIVAGCESESIPKRKGMCSIHYYRQWRENNQDREKEKARLKKYWDDNPDKRLKFSRDYHERHREKERLRNREYASRTYERDKHKKAGWKKENPDRVCAYTAEYAARKGRALPSWVTDDELEKIRELYAECKKISDSTGVKHQVDHIVPINGKTANGLHVLANLRIITAEENNRRSRIWNVDAQDCI